MNRQQRRHPARYAATAGFTPSPRGLARTMRGICAEKQMLAGVEKTIFYRANRHGKPKQKGSRILPSIGSSS